MQAIVRPPAELTFEKKEVGFKRGFIGWTIVILNTLAALNSTFVFLLILKAGIDGWVMMNICAPSIALFVIGFLVRNRVLKTAGSTMMFRYGTLGLYIFGWDGYNIPAQIGHILMTLAVIYAVVDSVRYQQWKSLGLGVALGIAILIPVGILQGIWFDSHPGLLEQLFSGNLQP
jgi:hypothetical protein